MAQGRGAEGVSVPFIYRPLVRESPRRPCGLRSHGLSQADLYGDRPALVRFGIGIPRPWQLYHRGI